MSRVCDITGKKDRVQRSHRHASGKSRAGSKAFASRGPHGLRGVKKVKNQRLNLVTVRTPAGKIKVSMKVYKKYFKKPWNSEEEKHKQQLKQAA